MATERKEQVKVVKDAGFERRQRVVEYAPETRTVILSRVSKLLWLLTIIGSGLLGFRFGLKLIASNPINGFVNFIYSITDVLVAPFNGIVNTPAANNGAQVDVAALIAIVVYILATWALIALLRILFAGTKSTRSISTIERES